MSALDGKKAVIFDLDGTLIDSVGMWNDVDAALIRALCRDERKDVGDVQKRRDDALKRFAFDADPYNSYCAYLKELYGWNLTAEEIREKRYRVSLEMLERVDYKPGADVAVRKLYGKGFLLAIASTTRRVNMEVYRTRNANIMRKAAIDRYFKAVFTCEDVDERKPSPEVYIAAASALGVKTAECLAFEDSLVGVQSAKNAGIETIAVYDRFSDKDRAAINALADGSIKRLDDWVQSESA